MLISEAKKNTEITFFHVGPYMLYHFIDKKRYCEKSVFL